MSPILELDALYDVESFLIFHLDCLLIYLYSDSDNVYLLHLKIVASLYRMCILLSQIHLLSPCYPSFTILMTVTLCIFLSCLLFLCLSCILLLLLMHPEHHHVYFYLLFDTSLTFRITLAIYNAS